LASLCCFAVLASFRAFAVCSLGVFHFKYFFPGVRRFPCVFFSLTSCLPDQTVLSFSLLFFLLEFLPHCFVVFRVFWCCFFCLLLFGAGTYVASVLCVLSALFLLVFVLLEAKFRCHTHAFLHVCSPSLALFALILCLIFSGCLFCIVLFGINRS